MIVWRSKTNTSGECVHPILHSSIKGSDNNPILYKCIQFAYQVDGGKKHGCGKYTSADKIGDSYHATIHDHDEFLVRTSVFGKDFNMSLVDLLEGKNHAR